jgi:methyl-branched lipid omega-hydroxylase
VTDSQTWSSDLNLSDNAFWAQPPALRHAAYRTLRALDSPPFFEAGESPFGTEERGYYALLRHADVAEASRNPQLFSSAAGAVSIYDLPTEFNEYFGSMISMDDPRHARLRRIVSRAFTPKMIKKF